MLQRHEQLEMEVLDLLNSHRLLGPLIFGGGTMLRLCHELPRASVDLDFWVGERIDEAAFLAKLQTVLGTRYEVTDATIKHFSILCEVRHADYPRRLKLEIRRELHEVETEQRIAYSHSSTRQVLVRVHTLAQTVRNKLAAALDRRDIRDCFDLEFLVQRGQPLQGTAEQLKQLRELATGFSPRDFKVTLGSLLDADRRQYYAEHGFEILLRTIDQQLSKD
jgi:predicted nucleotidyltransferase component of viral defense system